MRLLFVLALLLQLCNQASSQGVTTVSKPSLDTSVLGKWPELSNGALSANGKYISYVLEEHMPVDQVTTVIQSPDGKWKMELKEVRGIKFSNDSRSAYYLMHDTLYHLQLGTPQVIKMEGVLFYRLVPYTKGEWLVYQLKAPGKALIIQDEKTKKEKKFSGVETYTFSKDGEVVVLAGKNEDGKESRLTWIDLQEGKESNVWAGSAKPLQIIYDDKSTKVCFTTEQSGKRSVWLYGKGKASAELIVRDGDTSIEKGLVIGNLDRFSKDGERVFFNLERRYEIKKPNPDAPNVKVWRYNDLKLQSEQLSELLRKKTVKSYLSGIDLSNHKVYRMVLDNDDLKLVKRSENYTLVFRFDTDLDIGVGEGEWSWQPAVKNGSYYLVSNMDGSRKKLPLREIYGPDISPDERFIIYRPYSELHYYTYEISTGVTRNITALIETDLRYDDYIKNAPIEKQHLLSPAGWMRNDSAVIIYDHNDIWLVDASAIQKPKNITNGYGLKHGLIFRIVNSSKVDVFHSKDKLVLAAFDKRTKLNGQYLIEIDKGNDPERLNMEMPLYAINSQNGGDEGNISPASGVTKASNAEAFIYKKQTSTDFPNYYYTNDLKNFKQITFLAPEKSYNWMTSELHSWVAPDGDTLQGILCKPENFDPSKKYPVLFSIYRQFSDHLNAYWIPEWTIERINIPWFVSQGYLVFLPDIHYTNPNLKGSVVNCIVSAAKYLSKLPYIDSSKLGIQGHSFGGVEMGYVVTNTDIFAAGCATAGSFDFVSEAGTISPEPYYASRQEWFENTFIFSTLWKNKQAFIDNSAIFDADKLKTPFLIVAGEKDYGKPFDQNIEFFLGLRRLGKPVWMLTYEDEGHVISNKKVDAIDYTIRLTQFFNHYLKSAAVPGWMNKGILYREKGIETGYQLEGQKMQR